MTETNNTEPSMDSPEYREELLARAAMMGISVHPNAKNETIAVKIAAKLADKPDPEAGANEDDKSTLTLAPIEPALSKLEKELHPSKRLKRVLITCNDPQKADQSGDIISVSNGVVGNIRFYFHFNKPWHVPEIVLETLREQKLFLHSSRKDGQEIVTREVPRYNIQELPALDEKGRERIAAKQAAALATED
jgi:hypothetical protein